MHPAGTTIDILRCEGLPDSLLFTIQSVVEAIIDGFVSEGYQESVGNSRRSIDGERSIDVALCPPKGNGSFEGFLSRQDACRNFGANLPDPTKRHPPRDRNSPTGCRGQGSGRTFLCPEGTKETARNLDLVRSALRGSRA